MNLTRPAVGALLAASAIASPAHAALVDMSFNIIVVSGGGVSTFETDLSDASHWTQTSDGWTLTSPIALTARGRTLATLDEVRIGVSMDPIERLVALQTVPLSFAVTAGAAPTMFSISSAALPVALDPAIATASAGVSVTDNNGDGADFFGLFAGGGAYQARYNAGTVFAELLTTDVQPGAFLTETDDETTGPFAPVGVPVTQMQTEWSFMVSAFDSAAGTSIFAMDIPSPGALTLAGVGLAFALRRRRLAA
jgi:hypothetical protein